MQLTNNITVLLSALGLTAAVAVAIPNPNAEAKAAAEPINMAERDIYQGYCTPSTQICHISEGGLTTDVPCNDPHNTPCRTNDGSCNWDSNTKIAVCS